MADTATEANEARRDDVLRRMLNTPRKPPTKSLARPKALAASAIKDKPSPPGEAS